MAKGTEYRNCSVCGEEINYVLWKQELRNGKMTDIYHWANRDGSHHEHKSKSHSELMLPDSSAVAMHREYKTFRDEIAIAAMQGILTGASAGELFSYDQESVARRAYSMADVMLRVRQE